MAVTVVQAARASDMGARVARETAGDDIVALEVGAGIARGEAMLTRMAATAQDLALRYLLELSVDIRGALLMDRDGELLASAGLLPPAELADAGRRIVAAVSALAPDAREAVEVDAFAARGALFVLAETEHVMVCTTNRSVNPGLIFYDMHAVLRDIDRAAAAEQVREAQEPAGPGEPREAAGSGT
jgi:hypothetical protein